MLHYRLHSMNLTYVCVDEFPYYVEIDADWDQPVEIMY